MNESIWSCSHLLLVISLFQSNNSRAHLLILLLPLLHYYHYYTTSITHGKTPSPWKWDGSGLPPHSDRHFLTGYTDDSTEHWGYTKESKSRNVACDLLAWRTWLGFNHLKTEIVLLMMDLYNNWDTITKSEMNCPNKDSSEMSRSKGFQTGKKHWRNFQHIKDLSSIEKQLQI